MPNHVIDATAYVTNSLMHIDAIVHARGNIMEILAIVPRQVGIGFWKPFCTAKHRHSNTANCSGEKKFKTKRNDPRFTRQWQFMRLPFFKLPYK